MTYSRKRQRSTAGITLIELIVVVSLLALFMGTVAIGLGAATNARVRAAATAVASGIRVAFARSASTSKSMRMVFDMETHTIMLEEADLPMLVRRDDVTGTDGATAATPQETAAVEEAARLIKGPRAPRPLFKAVTAFGFDADSGGDGRQIGRGAVFRRIEISHSEDPYLEGRAYLYFWPGGQTERAAIQIGRAGDEDDGSVLTVLVSPLTGRVRIEHGSISMDRTREDSERSETGY